MLQDPQALLIFIFAFWGNFGDLGFIMGYACETTTIRVLTAVSFSHNYG